MIEITKRILIVTEDEKSSKLYFESFKKDEKLKRELSSLDIKVINPKDNSPVGLVDKAKEEKKKAIRDRNRYNEIWIVLDKDQHANLAQALNKAKDNKIRVAISIICFEYWILLHYEKTTKQFKNCDEVIKHIKKNHYSNYGKNTNCYENLKDRIEDAVKNAKWLMKQNQTDLDRGKMIYELDAYTNVHQLVSSILPKITTPKNKKKKAP